MGGKGLQSWGKYTDGMVETCEGCGNGPHQATQQVTDSQLEEFLEEECQLGGPELRQHIKAFHGG
jgi:hypothetical protein